MIRNVLFCVILMSTLLVGTECKQKPKNVKPTLHYAARTGDIQKTQKLISDGHEINNTDENGETPLHIASYNGHLEIVRLLLTNRADIHTKDKRGQTPLHHAAGAGQVKIVKMLITNGAEVTPISESFTPLHCAANEGHKDVVELLLDNGADINGKYGNDDTALSRAILNGHRDVVELLLARGADLTAGCVGKYVSIKDIKDKDLQELAENLVTKYGPYSIIISDEQSVRGFLPNLQIDYDRIWIPEKTDLEGLDDVLRSYLKNATVIKAKSHFSRKFVLTYLEQYSREYSGIIRDGEKYIICQMILPIHFPVEPPDNKFTIIHGFANGVVRVVFELKSKKVVEIDCEYWM